MEYTVRELKREDLRRGLLADFDRFQNVTRCWRREDGRWVLKPIAFVERWGEAEKQAVVETDLTACLQSGGGVWAAYGPDGRLAGFAGLMGEPLGSAGQYRQLRQLHVSHGHRSLGVGRRLFERCARRAWELGAAKLYISAHSAEETQRFYRGLGCADAVEIDGPLAELEPCDCQLEYGLGGPRLRPDEE